MRTPVLPQKVFITSNTDYSSSKADLIDASSSAKTPVSSSGKTSSLCFCCKKKKKTRKTATSNIKRGPKELATVLNDKLINPNEKSEYQTPIPNKVTDGIRKPNFKV